MIEIDQLSKALRESGLANGTAAAESLPSRTKRIHFDGPVEAAHIFRVYSLRSRSLASKQSEHAKQLKLSVDELLREIELHGVQNITGLTFPASRLGTFEVWLDAESNNPIGCFYTISKLQVSAAKWRMIWGES